MHGRFQKRPYFGENIEIWPRYWPSKLKSRFLPPSFSRPTSISKWVGESDYKSLDPEERDRVFDTVLLNWHWSVFAPVTWFFPPPRGVTCCRRRRPYARDQAVCQLLGVGLSGLRIEQKSGKCDPRDSPGRQPTTHVTSMSSSEFWFVEIWFLIWGNLIPSLSHKLTWCVPWKNLPQLTYMISDLKRIDEKGNGKSDRVQSIFQDLEEKNILMERRLKSCLPKLAFSDKKKVDHTLTP